ncbi:putative ROK1-ATP-dependent RNA helicase [Tilletiaria anomala UBC 951]|uniref:RNA helicase n=1 Tax=Tilletiaria anomala (strain ATCC 24038 / CBS 436.72 / UBC 951) TaxID=1037660 RepID=A0A066V9B0_TILAU|nr:putative ROK1-ATP-dependent RNA helicase [Tilletiaria anomala UBC 951]KDN38322.1 putative ROK1-ATP-dependent RNA helicase [Tilletiaria anomala UBC 951]
MDVFQALTGGGGIRFDKNRFARDVQLFHPHLADASASGSSPAESSKQASSVGGQNGKGTQASIVVPKELDFFGSAAKTGKLEEDGTSDKAKGKRKRVDGGEDAEEDASEGTGISEGPVTKETLSTFLKANRIRTKGTDVPFPLASWRELEERWKVHKYLVRNLHGTGWKTPTPIQKGAMGVMLDNRDLLAGAPTGSGKTLAFLLPILYHLGVPAAKKEGFRAVIVSPTRELAQQIYEQLRKLCQGRKWRICVLNNTRVTQAEESADPMTRKKYDILITTPLRLVHAIENNELDLSNVQHLVLDEADRLLEQNFLAQTDSILAACSHPKLRKALFSATLPSGVEEMANTFMVDECRVIVGTKDAANERIEQSLVFVGSEDGKLHALRSLIQEGKLKPPVLLFVQSIERAKELFHELVYDGLHVDVIHSERSKVQREGVIQAFKRGDVWVLICTELMARGIDFKGVSLVLNYDFPQTVQSYVHRIGRTGRAGKQGEAITFFTKDDAPYLKTVVNVMRQSGCDVPQWLLELKNPSQNAKKKLKRAPIERKDVRVAAGSIVGRKESIRKREMKEGSKRRKRKEDASNKAEARGTGKEPATVV